MSEVLDAATKRGDPFQLSEQEWARLGIHLFQIGQAEDAIVVLKKNASLHPADEEAFDVLAQAYRAIGKTELAAQNQKKADGLKPK